MNKQLKKINTRTITLTIIFILILITIALLIGKFTYSYLAPTIDDDVEGVGEVTASGDTIIFTKGNTLSLSANTDNFATGGNNLTSTTNPKVKLMASSKTNSASSTYYAGIIIKNNTYKYTTTDKLPEVILTVKDENGNIVNTSSDDLKFVTVNSNLQGFDITESSGVFNIVTNHVIATPSNKSEVIHTWTFTLTFVNLETDQSENENATLEMDVVLQKDKIPKTIVEVAEQGEVLVTALTTFNAKVPASESGLYHHDGTIKDENGNIIDAEDNSYRYAGANPNNYICFGSDEEICPEDNLYRIIGVFGEENHGVTGEKLVKIIKNSSIGTIAWNTNGYKYWNSATLNTTLNTTFITEKLSGVEDEIIETSWKISGFINSPSPIAKDVYTTEITNATKTVTAKIGLVYASDYGYATTPECWTTILSNYSSKSAKNWLYIANKHQWTITPNSFEKTLYYVYEIGWYGEITQSAAKATLNVRPSFYISPSIKYVSGSGTSTDPIRISL